MIVTKKAMRPASDDVQCFYCRVPVGDEHKPDCILIKKKVRLRVTIEYEAIVPAGWDKRQIEFHRNEGSWCADNVIDELAEYIKPNDEQSLCTLCPDSEFEYLEDVGKPYLRENGD